MRVISGRWTVGFPAPVPPSGPSALLDHILKVLKGYDVMCINQLLFTQLIKCYWYKVYVV